MEGNKGREIPSNGRDIKHVNYFAPVKTNKATFLTFANRRRIPTGRLYFAKM